MITPQHSDARRQLPLFWQIFIPNAALLAVAGTILALSPATVSAPVLLSEALVIVAGLIAMVVINLLLIRRTLRPLEQLTAVMGEVDLLNPGQRVRPPAESLEIAELARVFNSMVARLERERRESGRRLLTAQEGERRRLARELHDEFGQSLTALMLRIDRVLTRADPALVAELHEAREDTRALSDELQEIVRRLRPEALDDLGLTTALTVLAKEFSDRSGLPVRRRLDSGLPQLDPEAELVIYRVAQESLTNVARHADASGVELALVLDGDRIRLSVTDDGHGLNGAPAGSGIRGMRERALLVGAVLAIHTDPEGGTRVELEAPVEGPS
jgi:two-component system, NarL family, sensor histidine kinase UhpB